MCASGVREEIGMTRRRRDHGGIVMAMGGIDGEAKKESKGAGTTDGTEIGIGMRATGMIGGTKGIGTVMVTETGIVGGGRIQGLGHLLGESDGETGTRIAGGESGPWRESTTRSGGGWTECTFYLLYRTVGIVTLTLDICARRQSTIARQQRRATRHEPSKIKMSRQRHCDNRSAVKTS